MGGRPQSRLDPPRRRHDPDLATPVRPRPCPLGRQDSSPGAGCDASRVRASGQATPRRITVAAAIVLCLAAALLPATASAAPVTFSAPISIATGASLSGVACPSTAFCLAVGSHGEAVSSADPAGGAAAWSGRRIDGGTALLAVSCASRRLCLVLDGRGRVLTSSDPSQATGTWAASQLDVTRRCAPRSCPGARAGGARATLTAVDCPTARLCVVTDDHGDVFTSTDPTRGLRSWHEASPTADGLDGVSCASVRLCVAVTHGRRVIVSTRPTAGARAWASLRVLPAGSYGAPNQFGGISCPTAHFCLGAASDGFGAGLYSTPAPTRARTWSTARLFASPEPYTNLSFGDVACGTPDSCAAYTVDENGLAALYVSSHTTRWTAARFPGSDALSALTDIACASTTLCVAVDSSGDAVVGTAS